MTHKDKKKVVIVDDDLDLLNMLSFAFEEEGYFVKTFSEGEKALKELDDAKFFSSIDLLILDRMLEDMDGIDIAKSLKKTHKELPPILFLSVLSAEADIVKGLKAGAVDYITKPFHMEVLLQKAKQLIQT